MSTDYHRTEMQPAECEECDCPQHRWNLRSRVLVTDPPSTCECGHPTFRHRFRRTKVSSR